ncbi:MAG: ligase-associated DNA damage response DEXH box helicase, partial [Candidatus Omnitrophica bacterium]|nr:ligase-associated DNA damage response DEXH box helicase [Candidatus Omnitrophota bacterium]
LDQDQTVWDLNHLKVLWITPLKALAKDTCKNLTEPCVYLEVPWSVDVRTGDTNSYSKKKQLECFPTCLITTPESLSLLLSYPETEKKFAHLEAIVVDEWHELLSTKRGTQTELALAKLRVWKPDLQVWGLSATLGNLKQAGQALQGPADDRPFAFIQGEIPKRTEVVTLIPEKIDRLPYAGHLGLKMLPEVIETIESAGTTLLFTNTRSQSELWYQGLLEQKPEWAGEVALHHGSIDRESRKWVETELARGSLRCVVCTSSLDLGIDFSPVEQVIQVGSPKGVARFLQRAGRSGHQPGSVSRIVCVPSHAFELIEFAAAKRAVDERNLESREPLEKELDVLAQHLVTLAAGSGFDSEDLLKEVRSTWAYRNLTQEEWDWVLAFITTGSKTLERYPEYSKVERKGNQYRLVDRRKVRMHRMSIGTIASDASIKLKYLKGGSLGTVEEAFVSRLNPGDAFFFAGRCLEFVRVKDMTAYVRKSRSREATVPRWMGGRMPLSTQLAETVREMMGEGDLKDSPEMNAVETIIDLQRSVSHLPNSHEILIEQTKSREGHHVFLYPFEGRLVHEGLSVLIAHRMTQRRECSITSTANDYGIELLSSKPLDFVEAEWREFFRSDRLLEDIVASLNLGELARRKFREVARVAGLVFSGYPGQPKTHRQLQVSSTLLYEVFQKHDPENLLLEQAKREVLESQLEISRIKQCLDRMGQQEIVMTSPKRFTPLAFPLWAERIRAQVSSEKWLDRVQRMAIQIEKASNRRAKRNAPNRVARKSLSIAS